jgi:hypothetical protein
VTVLLADVEEAQRVAAALDEVRRPDGALVVIAVPPVRGLAFFADQERQEKLDRWWSHFIPANARPVYLLRHQPGIAEWLPGLDGRFVIGAMTAADAEVYEEMENVTVAVGNEPVDVAVAAAEMPGAADLFRGDAVIRLRHRLTRPANRSPQAGFRRARLRAADEGFLSGRASSGSHPIPNLPAAEQATARQADAPPHPVDEPGHDEVVRALAETLRHLRRIRTGV